MTRIFFIFVIIFLASTGFAQKVGIGTTTPAFKLDVRNGSINTDSVYRILGGTFLSANAGNTLVGFGSGESITVGNNNVAIGDAMSFTTTGFLNTAAGWNALNNNIAGSHNVAIGDRALEYNTASNNTAVGTNALGFNTTATFNAAFGADALSINTTGTKRYFSKPQRKRQVLWGIISFSVKLSFFRIKRVK